jgi:hypothetical protein
VSIQDDFQAYTNALGFVSNKPAGTSGQTGGNGGPGYIVVTEYYQ